MDPLSVGASVVGLLGAGGKITNVLFELVGKVREAPALAQNLLWEITDISAALGHLQKYIVGKQAISTDRGSLLLLEHVLTSLTGCVTTYSDFQAVLDELNFDPDMGLFDRVKWVHKESSLRVILQRLHNHKSSLILMLTTLQCETMEEARSSNERLCLLVHEMVRSNTDLASRIQRLERQGSLISKKPSTMSFKTDTNSSTGSARRSRFSTYLTSAARAIKLSFERDLEESPVYKRTLGVERQSLNSVASTALHSTAISIFSKLSLSEISVLSFYALPIYATDLRNGDCYVFGDSALFFAPAANGGISARSSDVAIQKSYTLANTTAKNPKVLFGVVKHRFEAEREDEMDAQSGEYMIVVAISNDEWFVVKSVGKIGGPGLLPVTHIEIRDPKTNKPVDDPLAAAQSAGIPSVQEWKKQARDYVKGSITLGSITVESH